jgi:hypothetical protein
LIRAEKVKRNIELITDNPTIVRFWRNVEEHAWRKVDNTISIHCNNGMTGNHQTNVFNFAVPRSGDWRYMLGPFPTWLIRRPPNRYATDTNYLELAFIEDPRLVGSFEALQNNVIHFYSAPSKISMPSRRELRHAMQLLYAVSPNPSRVAPALEQKFQP